MLAIKNTHLKAVQTLLKKGAKINQRAETGETALHVLLNQR